jgi:cytochrome c553
MNTTFHTRVLAVAALLLAGCQRHDPVGPVAASAPPASAASAAAPAPSGPIIAPPAAAPAPTAAQIAAGGTLASQGAGAVTACASCHGAQGEGNAAANFPRIAGQPYAYLLLQLQSYADDRRQHAVMAPIAKAMSPAQREDAAAYFASLPPQPASAPAAPPSAASGNAERGRLLSAAGDESKLVQACANCHGPDGSGGAANPYLAGQHAGYLVATLGAWRDGTRHNDPSGQMPGIAKSLSDADVQAVAAFFSRQAPPALARDADVASRLASAAPAASAVVSGPHTGGGTSTATQGIGSEQGAPLTGGAQGPGGGGGGAGSGSTGSGSTGSGGAAR